MGDEIAREENLLTSPDVSLAVASGSCCLRKRVVVVLVLLEPAAKDRGAVWGWGSRFMGVAFAVTE